MQFSRASDAVIHFEPYLAAMRELADINDVPLFRRHERRIGADAYLVARDRFRALERRRRYRCHAARRVPVHIARGRRATP